MYFNFTKEFVYEFDERLRKYDDLVRLTIKVPQDSQVAQNFELEALEKVMVKFTDGVYSPSDINVSAQFTSTNRPYEIGDSLELGFLNTLASFALRNDIFYANFRSTSIDERKKVIDANPTQFRKHDKTVVDIVEAFHSAMNITYMRAVEFVKSNKIFTLGSYVSFSSTNPDRLNLRDPDRSIQGSTNVHVFDPVKNKLFQRYYSTGFGSHNTQDFLSLMHDQLIDQDRFLEAMNDRRMLQTSNFFKYALNLGFMIKAVPYTVRNDLDPAEFFASKNTQPKNLYITIDDIIHLVPMVSLRDFKVEQEVLLEIIENPDYRRLSLSMCEATGHYFANGSFDVPNRRVDLLRDLGYQTWTSISDVTNAFADKFVKGLSTHQSIQCDRCRRISVQLDGDLESALALSEIEKFRNNVRDYINSRSAEHMNDFDGRTFCDNCLNVVHHQHSLYDGYFVGDYFVGELSVPTPQHINYPSHTFVQDYDYTPDDLYDLSNDFDIPSLGVELEVDSDDDTNLGIEEAASMAQTIITKGDEQVYLMSDGSLNFGFEMATYPADIYQHMNTRLFDYEPAFRNLVKAGFRGHDAGSAGLHVHLSREFFGNSRSEQLYRASLMAYIMESNWDEFVKFSRRRYHHLEQWAKKKDVKVEYDYLVSSEKNEDNLRRQFVNEYDMDKYVAFNINHRHTFELRIFRSTLNYNTYLATLQFVHNFAMLAKRIDLGEAQLITFKDIIKEHSFDELNAYVSNRFGSDYLN